METSTFWRKCTSCKKPISFSQKYWICSVSTCNRQRTGLVFCTVACFDAHVPVMSHRDAGAIEKKAPAQAEFEQQQRAESAAPGEKSKTAAAEPKSLDNEVLVVVSKMKDYIRSRSGMNTSDSVSHVLSDFVRKWCDQAIASANQSGRKTVLDRDIH